MPLRRVTKRQLEVAELIWAGLTVVAVARRLNMPIATARSHVRDLAVKLPNPHGLPAYRLIQSYKGVPGARAQIL
jgi:DNA-binding CsgD family transcriptional regulator